MSVFVEIVYVAGDFAAAAAEPAAGAIAVEPA